MCGWGGAQALQGGEGGRAHSHRPDIPPQSSLRGTLAKQQGAGDEEEDDDGPTVVPEAALAGGGGGAGEAVDGEGDGEEEDAEAAALRAFFPSSFGGGVSTKFGPPRPAPKQQQQQQQLQQPGDAAAAGEDDGEADVGPPRPPADGSSSSGGEEGEEGWEAAQQWRQQRSVGLEYGLPIACEASLEAFGKAVTTVEVDPAGGRMLAGGHDYQVRAHERSSSSSSEGCCAGAGEGGALPHGARRDSPLTHPTHPHTQIRACVLLRSCGSTTLAACARMGGRSAR